MGADNYAMCPQCSKDMTKLIEDEDKRIKTLYGKVSIKEWEELVKGLGYKKELYMDRETTFREYYEIYNDDKGVVTINYDGQCQECGLKAQFKKEIEIL